ncbi:MAG: trigger factor [Clostridia bacterium]
MEYKVNKEKDSKVVVEFKLTIEEFNTSLDNMFIKNAKSFKVPGFRAGKVPRAIVEKNYGEDVLNYSVVEDRVDDDFKKVIDEEKLEIVSKPELNVTSIGKDKECIYTVTFFVKPDATVSKYIGLEVKKNNIKVTEKEVDAEILTVLEKNSRIITVDDRELKDGDISNINFEGFKDGVGFEGGKAENFELTIGSGQFIPGFEEKMIGMKIGEEKDVEVTFPADYHVEDLKGAPVIFKVKLNSITCKELPALDDEFVKDVSEFETLKDYKVDVKNKLVEKKIAEAKNAREIEIFDKIIENTSVIVPDTMIDEKYEELLANTEKQMASSGMTLEMYCKYTNQDMTVVKTTLREQSLKDIKFNLAMEYILDKENIEITDEDAQYGKESESNFKNNDNIKEYLAKQLKQEKVIDKIMESVIEK